MSNITLTPEQVGQMQSHLKQTGNVKEYQRIVAILAVNEGKSVNDVAKMLGVTRQCIYYWLGRRVQPGEQINLKDAPRSGRPSLLTEEALEFVGQALRHSPQKWGFSEVHWTLPVLQQHLILNSTHRMSNDTLRRLLLRLGYSWTGQQWISQKTKETTSPVTTINFQGAIISGADNSVKRIYPASISA